MLLSMLNPGGCGVKRATPVACLAGRSTSHDRCGAVLDRASLEPPRHSPRGILSPGTTFRGPHCWPLASIKLAAAAEPRRRLSKRHYDLADVAALMEDHPELRTPETLARLRDVRLSLQVLDDG